MPSFNQRITRIKGLSDKRRLPRLGRVRLGIKVANSKGVTYPKEVPYFVVPDEVKAVYGDKPTELDVMLPLDDIDTVFPVSYKFYGSGKGLKCNGDGEIAYCADEKTKEVIEKKCPCELLEQGKCKQSGSLSVMLQKINVGGVYQINTSSFNSIVDLASGIDYVKALIGRVAMVPLKLRRVATETHHEEKKQTHYTLQLVLDANIDAINQLRGDTIRVLEHTSRIALPEPENSNPELDPPDEIVDDDIPPELGNEQETKPNPYLLPEYDKGQAVKCPANKGKIRPKIDCDTCDSKSNCIAWGLAAA
ncbi:MAG: hypothetical protein WDA41_08445 [Candidatus Neomarinimicrobiota bacterium]|jgi:hypothetical protein